jgi:hypothetical protein
MFMPLRRLALPRSLYRLGGVVPIAFLVGAAAPDDKARDIAVLDRITWGANPSSAAAMGSRGADQLIDAQLRLGVDTSRPCPLRHRSMRWR